MNDKGIKIHKPEDFDGMRKAGKLAAEVLDFITPYVKPGVTTGELDTLCAKFTEEAGAVSAPLNYRGFPKSICTSINHVVCHGIPDDAKKLKEGDCLNIDITVILDGWYGDTSRMFFVGDKISVKARKLVETTYECLMLGIEQVKPGATLGDIGSAIQTHAEAKNYSVVRDFCGHGIGRVFHDAPSVVHYSRDAKGRDVSGGNWPVLQEGMFFTIEPMINAGKFGVKVLNDGWTAVTKDKSLSAQFEHTIAVTADGYEIFTQSPKGWTIPPYS